MELTAAAATATASSSPPPGTEQPRLEQQPPRQQHQQQQRLLSVPTGQRPRPRQPNAAGTPPPRVGRVAPPSPQYSYAAPSRSTNPNRPSPVKRKDSGYSSWSAATPRTLDAPGAHEQGRGHGLGAAVEEGEGEEEEEEAYYTGPDGYDGYDDGNGVAGGEYEHGDGEYEQEYYDESGRYHAWDEEDVEYSSENLTQLCRADQPEIEGRSRGGFINLLLERSPLVGGNVWSGDRE
ncbi:hypothetical protein MYCTH_91274 [Thermothelomyces thermophilus ATCC 42464]|uniref:Uncharacterized protein n=1 Tax=Thermothelomyces thermophilus (strain ATCC 42464 / BCRC 31852 / DSM 1799) TaxID=573729 RepID=G2Q5E3_THET4|nr:uncharacterized protein MYCTH_91274 [Thermothelomyces thermophilus ATCC 42464]AEO53774.1 hypothetical protein MYCTH_91274 [Thermothelomyces thermophilus ATCC 42464]